MALFSFNVRSNTYGRISGLGYTGSEETTVRFNGKLEKIVGLDGDKVRLVN